MSVMEKLMKSGMSKEDLNSKIRAKVMDKCFQRFGYIMPWDDCSRLLSQVLNLNTEGVPACQNENYSELYENIEILNLNIFSHRHPA